MKRLAMSVSVSIPPITTVPRIRRPTAPAPAAVHNGTQPRINANEVMKRARRRTRTPSSAASTSGIPPSYATLANSTMRIAFLAARPITMSRPICEKTSSSKRRSHSAPRAPNRAMGVASRTANGSVQLSYRAAMSKNTTSTEKPIDLRRAVLVEPGRELRAVDLSHPDQRRQRHRLTRGVAYVEATDIVGLCSELAFSLQVHLADAAVLVEVVHEGAAEKRLEGLVHRGQGDALLQHLVAIHLGEELRHTRQQGREESRELGPLPGGGQECFRLLREERGMLARAILEPPRHTAGRSD